MVTWPSPLKQALIYKRGDVFIHGKEKEKEVVGKKRNK
jgi:hypothetical protein